MKKENNSCSCHLTEPCSYACTCNNSLMSGGCERCCAYGSLEQRKAMAIKIATMYKNMKEPPQYKFALREDLKDQKEFLPTRAEPLATGWDVRVALENGVKELIVSPMDYVKIPLGFRAFCPPGWWLELKPRSSSFTKKYLHALYGTIDMTFEGTMMFAAQYIPSNGISYKQNSKLILTHGEAIGQIIPVKLQEMIVESVSNEEYDALCKERNAQRGAGGFGSTTEIK